MPYLATYFMFLKWKWHLLTGNHLCSSSLLSWCRDRGGEGSSISLRKTPDDRQQVASMPTLCPGSLSLPRPRRERRPPACCCPVVLMELRYLPLVDLSVMAFLESCGGKGVKRERRHHHRKHVNHLLRYFWTSLTTLAKKWMNKSINYFPLGKWTNQPGNSTSQCGLFQPLGNIL